MKFSSFLYLIFILGVLGCKGPKEPEAQGDAVFYFNGSLGESQVSFAAGDNSYFMYTNYIDDYLDIRSFTGGLGRLNCVSKEDCPGRMSISIREKEKLNGARQSIDQCIKVQEYQFRGPAEYLFQNYKATFISKSTPIGIDHVWDFGDGSTSSDVNPVHYYLNEADSIVTPSLDVFFSSTCISTVEYPISFTSGCVVDFFASYDSGLGYFTWNSVPSNGRTERWDFGSGYMPQGPNNLPPSNDSIFKSCLESTDINGCVSYKCKNIVVDTPMVHCVSNFDVITEVVETEDIRDYSEVTVEWELESGKKFLSNRFAQPTNSNFSIISVDDYQTDQNGNSTKKLTVQFSVRLFGDSENDFLDVVTEKSVFAIAYP